MAILIVQETPALTEQIREALTKRGLSAESAISGSQAVQIATGGGCDAILLDRRLPDGDGVACCREMRRSGVATPILMLASESCTDDKVSGLEAGADDYVVRPFEIEELVARIRSLLRRGEARSADQLQYDDLAMDLNCRAVTRSGRPIPLTNKEFNLLEFLVRRRERVLTRSTIGAHVWDTQFEPSSNVIDVYISMLRKKVDRPFTRPLIHTVIGAGYLFGAGGPYGAAFSKSAS
jgi:DNA-binding response OmpR family regulator